MDQEDFIKIQHQSPIKSGDNFANYYMTQFYDQDSLDDQEFIKKEDISYLKSISSFELLQQLSDQLDFRTISTETIIQYAKNNFILNEQIDWVQFQKRIRKKKIALKRHHAKNREVQQQKSQYFVFADTVEGTDVKEEVQAQIKKKRNRMSAQISRDRKKIQIQQLEQNNKKLKEETEKIIRENQRLKQQLQQFNKAEEKKVEASKGKSKFLTILIMFGMLFLMTILRDSGKGSSIKISGKVEKEQRQILSASEQTKIVNEGQKMFQGMEEEDVLGSKKILKNVMFKLQEIKSSVADVFIPKSLKEELEQIQKQVI